MFLHAFLRVSRLFEKSERNDQLLPTNSPISRILRPFAWDSRLAINRSFYIFWDDVLGDDVVMSRMHLWNYNGR